MADKDYGMPGFAKAAKNGLMNSLNKSAQGNMTDAEWAAEKKRKALEAEAQAARDKAAGKSSGSASMDLKSFFGQ